LRQFWTFTAQSDQKPADISREAGFGVFRREQDGKWRIIRFIAFTENSDR
jgi:ketosteroid isomerase-like protein